MLGVRAPVAQLDRAPDFESVGRRFESCRARQRASRAGAAGRPQAHRVARHARREWARVRSGADAGGTRRAAADRTPPRGTHTRVGSSPGAARMPARRRAAAGRLRTPPARARTTRVGSSPRSGGDAGAPRTGASGRPQAHRLARHAREWARVLERRGCRRHSRTAAGRTQAHRLARHAPREWARVLGAARMQAARAPRPAGLRHTAWRGTRPRAGRLASGAWASSNASCGGTKQTECARSSAG